MTRPASLPALQRVGHKGADAAVAGNTRESFQAALDIGVDMIEFDVLRVADGSIVLAHDFEEAAHREPLTLDEGLDLLAGDAYAGVELDVDLKLRGYEREVVEALRLHGLLERSLVSSTWLESLERIGELEPALRRGWSLPRARRDYTLMPLVSVAARLYLRAMASWLPREAARRLREASCEAVMAHHLLIGPRLVDAVHTEAGLLYAWTVDHAPSIAALDALGVDGVITNDPRLFQSRPARDEHDAA